GEYRVARAAELEGAAALQALGLEQQLASGARVERAGAQDRRHFRVGRYPCRRVQHVVELRKRDGRHRAQTSRSPPDVFSKPNAAPAGLSTDSKRRADAADSQERGFAMIRKLLIPLLAAVALSGCVSDYYHRGGGGGDYYYGSPGYSGYYGAPYSSLGYGYDGWYGGVGYGHGYGRYAPYRRHYGYGGWYGSPFYGYSPWPSYYYPYYPRPRPRPDHEPPPPTAERGTGGNLPPRRQVAPQPQHAAPSLGPQRRMQSQPLRRPSMPVAPMAAPQPRMQQRRSAQPLAPAPSMRAPAPASVPRMDRPAPRMQSAPVRATPRPAPRMERRTPTDRDRRAEP